MRKALIETVARLSEFLSITQTEAAGEDFRRRVEAALSQARRELAINYDGREVETFLTRKAQDVWLDAIVYRLEPDIEDGRPYYFLDRVTPMIPPADGSPPEKPRVLIGRTFNEARETLSVILHSARARQSPTFLP